MREIVCEIKKNNNNYSQFHLRGRSARSSAAAPGMEPGQVGRGPGAPARGADHPGSPPRRSAAERKAHQGGPLVPISAGHPARKSVEKATAAASQVSPLHAHPGACVTTNAPFGRDTSTPPLGWLVLIIPVSVQMSPLPKGPSSTTLI